ncbi:type I methionyl aminopeptidase [Patescibacteria group bacterium]
MDIPIKTQNEIEIMQEAGAILGRMLQELKSKAVVGMDVWDFEEAFLKMCEDSKVRPACKSYTMHDLPPFPTGLCISLNDQSVHCFPVKGSILKDGDVVTLDTVIEHKGMYVDSAITFGVGKVLESDKKLMEAAEKALYESIKVIKPGIKLGLISNTMQNVVEKNGFTVLKDYAGHGIGNKMHELPEVPCYGDAEDGPIIKAGMVFAIEPLVCENEHLLVHSNNWQTKTADGGNFVQFEHTVLVTKDGYEILTK